MLLEKKEERGNLEAQIEFLIKDINIRIKRLIEITTGNIQVELLLQQQNTECQAKVNNMFDKISDINQSNNKNTTENKNSEIRATNDEKLKREYDF